MFVKDISQQNYVLSFFINLYLNVLDRWKSADSVLMKNFKIVFCAEIEKKKIKKNRGIRVRI